MGLLGWLLDAEANTQEPSHRDLAPLVVPLPPNQAAALLRSVVQTLTQWQVEGEQAGELRLQRRAGFPVGGHTLTVTLKPAGPGTMIHAVSRRRGGVAWPGECRRAILELFDAVRKSV